jgi:hypothetical protein
MRNHLQGLSLLYHLFAYSAVLVTIFEAPYTFYKLFAVAYGAYVTFQLLDFYQNEN